MKYKSILFHFILFFSFSLFAIAQDTITVMQYNLLKYSSSGGACIPIAGKTADLKTTLKYIMPDILGVNEMYPSYTTIDYLLNNALNTDGVSYYKRATFTNLSNSPDLINALYYNDNKFGFISNTPIQSLYRDINIFRLYYKDANLASTHDTVYLYVTVAHLKASNNPQDILDRSTMTNALMNYLNNINVSNNYLCQGDFNLYTSTEQGYQNLIGHTNPNIRFYDPINRPGDWHINYSFKDIHTQSAHNSGNLNGCFVTGGLDDRFDFILISKDIKDGNKKVQYVPGSYRAIGQDGLHYNNDLTNPPTNTSAPTAVINALYNTSDHLPVMLKLKITTSPQSISENNTVNFNVAYSNPVKDELLLKIESEKPEVLKIQIISILGNTLSDKIINSLASQSEIKFSFTYPKGIYFLRIIDSRNNAIIKKIVKE